MNHEYLEFVKSRGINLEKSLGVKEWAFNRSDALALLAIMKKAKFPCLGGDVIVDDGRKLIYTKDNWYYNRREGETEEEYVEKSISQSEEYIRNYPEGDGKSYYYVLV